jgi:putative oxidoreductase
MTMHGALKLSDWQAWSGTVAQLGIPFPTVAAWLAIAGELAGGIGLIVGFLTPIAALGVLCTMLAAIFTVHWGHGLLAQNNGSELPLTIALVAGFFMIRGAGPFSIDALIVRLRQRSKVGHDQPPKWSARGFVPADV